jgi:sulfonate transport system substrate-binding protein
MQGINLMSRHSMKTTIILKRLFLCLSIVTAAFSLPACQEKEQSLHYGGQLYAQEFLLQGMDFWSPYNLDVEHVLFSNPDDLVDGFLKGVVDIALFSEIQAAQIFSEMGEKAVIIAIAESGDRITTLVRADSEIENWDDLDGKRVALRSGSGAELAMKRYFSLHDMNWNAIEWFNLPVDDMPDALAEGAVDAITAVEPIPAMARAGGGMRIMQSYGDCCPAPMVLVTTASFARENAEKIVRFLQGHLDKVALIEDDAALAARTAAKEALVYDLEIPASAFHIVFMRVDFSMEIKDSLIESMQYTAAALRTQRALDSLPEFVTDGNYLEQAMQSRQN